MPRPAPADYLQESEGILHQTGRHPLSVLDEILGATFLAAVPIAGVLFWILGFQPGLMGAVGIPVIAAVVALWAIFLLTRWFRVTTSLYTITNERTYKSHGRLRFFLFQTTYDKLTDLHVRQSLFGRIWGFGTVRLETAGTGIALEGVRDPFGYKQVIENARSDFLRVLVGESAPRPAPEQSDEWRPVVEDPAWQGAPVLASFLGSLMFAAAMLVFVVAGVMAAGQLGTRALLFSAVVVVFVIFNLFGIWVRVRYTRYHVGATGVVVTSGWLTRRRVETTYGKVTDVMVYQGLLGRALGFGTITINTAGSSTAPVVFQGVPDPEAVKEMIDEARRQWEAS